MYDEQLKTPARCPLEKVTQEGVQSKGRLTWEMVPPIQGGDGRGRGTGRGPCLCGRRLGPLRQGEGTAARRCFGTIQGFGPEEAEGWSWAPWRGSRLLGAEAGEGVGGRASVLERATSEMHGGHSGLRLLGSS